MKSNGMLAKLEWWHFVRRYAQFSIVGCSGMVVDMGIIYLLADPEMLGWNLTLSKAIAAEVALLNNFVWNELWTFRELAAARAGWQLRLARLLKFNLICAAGIGLNVILLNTQVHGLGWNVYLSNCIAIVLVSLWNFFLNLSFGWQSGADQFPPSSPDVDRGAEVAMGRSADSHVLESERLGSAGRGCTCSQQRFVEGPPKSGGGSVTRRQ